MNWMPGIPQHFLQSAGGMAGRFYYLFPPRPAGERGRGWGAFGL